MLYSKSPSSVPSFCHHIYERTASQLPQFLVETSHLTHQFTKDVTMSRADCLGGPGTAAHQCQRSLSQEAPTKHPIGMKQTCPPAPPPWVLLFLAMVTFRLANTMAHVGEALRVFLLLTSSQSGPALRKNIFPCIYCNCPWLSLDHFSAKTEVLLLPF